MLRTIDGTTARPSSGSANLGTYGVRTRPPSSSKRKLGQTRNSHKIPCAICEKNLIKQHVWDLNR